uniref:Uncharacterized protein n=1 Tax=Oryza brachyantha TaxID=4533 RepID=J3MSJ2_ORYBR
MERSAVTSLALLLLLAAMADRHGPAPASAQVFCRSQFNLAYEACSIRALPGVRPPVPRRQLELNETSVAGGRRHGLHSRGDGDDDDEAGDYYYDADSGGEGAGGGGGGPPPPAAPGPAAMSTSWKTPTTRRAAGG